MKKIWIIGIPLLVVISIAVVLILLNRSTPAWQPELEQFQAYQISRNEPATKILRHVSAAHAGNFTPQMSAASFSDSVIFQTTITSPSGDQGSAAPLPYPPDEVECILLRAADRYELVYAAIHSDLYNADWIIHRSPNAWGSNELQSTLDLLGCNLDF